jgi:hypothetical protein
MASLNGTRCVFDYAMDKCILRPYKMNAGRKYYFYTGLACLLGLAILSIIFFKERIAFSDTAYQAVYLLIEQRPFVNWVRIGSVITQAMPLMAIWLHAGLYTVMVLHSLSFIVFFTAIYLLAYRFSKTTLLFFIIPLYLVLITTEVFYWPQSELQQGMLWLCLYAVLIFEKKWHKAALWQFLSIHFLCILWIQFFHPLIFFPLIFLVIYYYGSRPQLFSEKAFYHLMLCGIAFGIRDVVGMMDPYEKSKLNIGGAMKNNLPHFFSLGSVHAFVHKLPSSYFIYTLFLAVSLLWLTANRKYIKALALSIFSAGYWILIMVSSPQDTRFYTENMLLPLGFMVALAVAADIIPAIRARYIPLVFFVAIIIRLAFIYHAHRDYTAHFSIYRQYFDYIKKNKLTGLFVDERLVDRQRAISTWGSGYESILISSLVSPDSCRVVQIDPEPHHYNWAIDNDTSLITIYGVWHQSQLPQRYFRLSGGKYEMLIKQP